MSFVFGLEVNWSLLQARQAERADEEEARKARLKKDLEELNALRRRRKDGIVSDHSSDSEAREDDEGEEEADFDVPISNKGSSSNNSINRVLSDPLSSDSDEDSCNLCPIKPPLGDRKAKFRGFKHIDINKFAFFDN